MKKNWEEIFLKYFENAEHDQSDASHDLGHFTRVAVTARKIAGLEDEPVENDVLIAAAYLHDIVSLPKNHPEAKKSSLYAADKARSILKELLFPSEKIEAVCHSIHAHSFSAQVIPNTIEAKIIHDSDRMEALGALGAMRTFYVAGRMGSQAYHKNDLLANHRELDDKSFALDHFYCKLFKLPALLQTKGGRQIAEARAEFLHRFVEDLSNDVGKGDGGSLIVVSTCYDAGKFECKLFDSKDPFAKKRPLEPSLYVVDSLIQQKNDPIVKKFLEQFQTEI